MAKILLNAAEMRALDALAIEGLGIPGASLMETAGRHVAAAAHRLLGRAGRVLVLAGVGNNGGDGLVAARALSSWGHEVRVLVIGDAERGSADFARQLEIWTRLAGRPEALTEATFDDAAESRLAEALRASELVVDAIFGTGLSRTLAPWLVRVVTATDLSPGPVLSIDVPSGLDASSGQELGAAVHAELTVTFQHAKLGLHQHPGRFLAGQIEVVDIGIPAGLLDRLPDLSSAAELLDEDDLARALEPRLPYAHKGDFGHLLVAAGTPDRPGSALLAARAAARVGAGLVTVASDEETVRRLAPAFLELMGATVGADEIELEPLVAALTGKDALVLGPSLPPERLRLWLPALLARTELPMVLDAGALGAFADPSVLRPHGARLVLTPHPGEAGRLLGRSAREVQADRIGAARALQSLTGATVVLKGAGTLIVGAEGRLAVVDRGDPSLATAGTGDVLAGVIGGLLAQGHAPRDAARAGVLLHAIAGERAARVEGAPRVVASDLLDHLLVEVASAAS